MSQPRAELFAAVLNAHTGEVVKRSLGKYHQSYKKLKDSQIALHWVSSSNKPQNNGHEIELLKFDDLHYQNSGNTYDLKI